MINLRALSLAAQVLGIVGTEGKGLAGLATGVWDTPADAAAAWREEASFGPTMGADEVTTRRAGWSRAVERSRDWA